MAGPIGANVLQALKVLTPSEINRITDAAAASASSTASATSSDKMVDSKSITTLASKTNLELVEDQSHLLDEDEDPYKSKSGEDDDWEEEEEEVVDEFLGLSGMERLEKKRKKKKTKEKVARLSQSEFIIAEKLKTANSNKILKRQEIYNLYEDNQAVDLKSIIGKDGDISETDSSGVLINKKRF